MIDSSSYIIVQRSSLQNDYLLNYLYVFYIISLQNFLRITLYYSHEAMLPWGLLNDMIINEYVLCSVQKRRVNFG